MSKENPAAQDRRRRLLENSRVFCILPWASVNIQPTGEVFPCCVADRHRPVGLLNDSPLAEIWNSEEFKRLRRNMLEDRESPECFRCYELERAGFQSIRQENNETMRRHWPVVGQTGPDGSVPHLNVAYLDVRFSNVCNFRCRYCCSELSTGWREDELKLYGRDRLPAVLKPTEDPERFWRDLEAILPRVEMIYFSGGEPLIAPEHYRVLQALIANKRAPDVSLLYSTNFSTLSFAKTDVTELWKSFKKVHLAASLDGMGPQGEYIRKNQNWEEVLRLRRLMLEKCPEVGFNLAPTLTAMNALHLPDFHWDWLERGYIGVDDIYINMLVEPEGYSAQVLPDSLKRQAAEKYGKHVERVRAKYGAGTGRVEAHFKAAANFMAARDKSELLPDLRHRIASLDAVRNERFADIFPEVAAGIFAEG